MGQHWTFFNFDKKEKFEYGNLNEIFFAELSRQLLTLVTRPTATSVILEKIKDFIEFKSKQFLMNQTGTLSKIHHNTDPSLRSPLTLDMLPSDIIFIIFAMLSDIQDVTAFALTCSTFWLTGKTRLSAVRDQSIMLWSGCRIGCFGDYANDTPPDLLTDAECAEFKAYAATAGDEDDPLAVIFNFLDETFLMATFSDLSFERWRFVFDGTEHRVLSALYDRPPLLSPVLRNLTKREYIREDQDTMDKLDEDNVFGQVLLARICWSTDPSTSMAYAGDLHRGQWAGDRVDCMEFQDFEKDLSEQSDDHDGEQRPWKDITEEAWGLWVDIYEAEWSEC